MLGLDADVNSDWKAEQSRVDERVEKEAAGDSLEARTFWSNKSEGSILARMLDRTWRENKLTNSMDNEQETRSEKVPPAKKQVWVKKEKKVKDPLLDMENCKIGRASCRERVYVLV